MPSSILRLLRNALLCLVSLGGALAWAGDLTVSAAASLTNSFTELARLFEAANPGARVRLNFGASGALLQQIARGAPVDVLVSADEVTMDQAQSQGLLRQDSRHIFASNQLVLVVPAGKGPVPSSLKDLTRPTFRRIAMGQPTIVPAGRYAQAALQSAGLWGALESRIVNAHSVRQALDYVARAEVDAGFVYATDAAAANPSVAVAFGVPTTTPIRYPVAIVRGAAEATQASRFVEFLLSAPAQALMARHGFGKP
jgi:molybdate transport system substrate-binding protein